MNIISQKNQPFTVDLEIISLGATILLGLERVTRIELVQPGRKHGILPLNYTRIKILYHISHYKSIHFVFFQVLDCKT